MMASGIEQLVISKFMKFAMESSETQTGFPNGCRCQLVHVPNECHPQVIVGINVGILDPVPIIYEQKQ